MEKNENFRKFSGKFPRGRKKMEKYSAVILMNRVNFTTKFELELEVKSQVDAEVAKSATLALASDGWSDVTGHSIVNFIVFTNDGCYLWDYVNTDINQCTGE